MVHVLHTQRSHPLVVMVVSTQIACCLRGCHNLVLHMQIRGITINRETCTDRISCFQFCTIVLDFTRIDILHIDGLNHVVTLYIKEVKAIFQTAVQTMTPRQLVVPETLWLQLFVGRLIQIHLLGISTTETFAGHRLQLACSDRTDNDTCLWNPLITSHRVVVVAQTSINSQPVCQVLTKINITCDIISMRMTTLHQTLLGGNLFTRLTIGIVGTSIDMLIIHANGSTVALKQLG